MSALSKLTYLLTKGHISPSIVPGLCSLTQLKSLALISTITSADSLLPAIASSLVFLTSLDLSDSSEVVGPRSLPLLHISVTELQQLCLYKVPISGQQLASLRCLPACDSGRRCFARCK